MSLDGLAEFREFIHDPLKDVIHDKQGRGGNQSSRQRGIGTHHGILDRIADEQHKNQIQYGQLLQLFLAKQANGHNDKQIDDQTTQHYLSVTQQRNHNLKIWKRA